MEEFQKHNVEWKRINMEIYIMLYVWFHLFKLKKNKKQALVLGIHV